METELRDLYAVLRSSGPMAIAYSGGLDSRFLCHAALLAGCDVLAIHAAGPHIAPKDSEFARDWAKKQGLTYVEIHFDPLDLPEVSSNSRQRCRACKSRLFELLLEKLAAMNEQRRIVCDGGNADDLKSYRPGLAAAKESGVLSPLAGLGLGKTEIRELGRILKLDYVEQKARPCLLTRMDYGLRPNPQLLGNLAGAEEIVASLIRENGLEACDFRLRLLPEPVLHILPGARAIFPQLAESLERAGFAGCGIVELDNLSGFFDRRWQADV